MNVRRAAVALAAVLVLAALLVVFGPRLVDRQPLPSPRPWHVDITEVAGWDVMEDEYFLPDAARWQRVGEEVGPLVDLVNGAGRAGEPEGQQIPPAITVLLKLKDGSVFTVWMESPDDPDSAQINRCQADGAAVGADWPRIKARGLRGAAERLVQLRQEAEGASAAGSPTTTLAGGEEEESKALKEAPGFPLADVAYVEFRDGASGAPYTVRTPGWNARELEALLDRLASVELTGGLAQPLSGGLTLTVQLLDGGWSQYGVDEAERRAILWYAPAPPEGAEAVIASSGVVYSDQLADLIRSAARVTPVETNWADDFDAQAPDGLGFVLAYGIDAKNVIDTFSGTFTKDLISNLPPSSATAALELTPEEIAGIYQEMRDIGLSEYPQDFRLASKTPPACTPFQSYYLLVGVPGSGTILKEFRWDDSANDLRPEAQALHRLVERIRALIESKPEFKAMPPLRGGYASVRTPGC